MYDYGRTYTAIKCPNCNSSEAKCNTNMMLTSEPPQYACFCDVCGKNWYVYIRDLTKYTESATVVSADSTKALEDRITKLEQMVETLRISIVNMSQALIRY